MSREFLSVLLIRNRSWILAIHKTKGHSTYMNFERWVKSIQTSGYNGARTVYFVISLPFQPKFEQLPWPTNAFLLWTLQTQQASLPSIYCQSRKKVLRRQTFGKFYQLLVSHLKNLIPNPIFYHRTEKKVHFIAFYTVINYRWNNLTPLVCFYIHHTVNSKNM